MDNHEEELQPLELVAGSLSNFAYQRPAISLYERHGELESTREFTTLEDYAGWKALQD